jgi:hypothetical protein
MMLGLKSKAFLERVYSARGEGKFLKDMPNVSKDQQVDLYGIFRMITKNDGDLAHHDYMNVFFNICDDIIELPDPDNSSSSSTKRVRLNRRPENHFGLRIARMRLKVLIHYNIELAANFISI